MIRPIQESEMTELLEILWQDSAVNYFMLVSHLEHFSKIASIDGIFDNEKLIGALFKRHSGNVQIFTTSQLNGADISTYLGNSGISSLIGDYNCISELADTMGFKLISQASVLRLEPNDFIPLLHSASIASRAVTPEDAEAIKELYRLCFSGSLSETLIRKNLEVQSGRGRAILNNGRVLAVVQTIFEQPHQAILYGVATLEEFRGQGYAALLLNEVIGEVTGEGKTIELLVESEIAKSLYYQLGFKLRTNIAKAVIPTDLNGA